MEIFFQLDGILVNSKAKEGLFVRLSRNACKIFPNLKMIIYTTFAAKKYIYIEVPKLPTFALRGFVGNKHAAFE